jgi:FkbM family methyltransferase
VPSRHLLSTGSARTQRNLPAGGHSHETATRSTSGIYPAHLSSLAMRQDQKEAVARTASRLDRPGSAAAAPSVLFRGPREWMDDFSDLWLHDYIPRPGDVVVDVGAGIGTEVYPLSKLVGNSGMVIGIEAFPPVSDCLSWTVRANGLTNVRLHCVAVSDQAGALEISTDIDATEHNSVFANDLFLHSGQTKSVPADTLDTLLADVPHIAWLKMNIEGAERPALLGAREVLGRTDHVVISCHDFIADVGGPDELRTAAFVTDLLHQHGFTTFRRLEQTWWRRDRIWGDKAS